MHHTPPLQSGGIFDISEEELLHSLKKKHCQRLAWLVKFFPQKLGSLAKSLSATVLLRSPKIVCARLAAALSSHTCVCGVPVNSTIGLNGMVSNRALCRTKKTIFCNLFWGEGCVKFYPAIISIFVVVGIFGLFETKVFKLQF